MDMDDTFLLALNTAEGVLQLVLGKDTPQGAGLVWSESLPAASQGAELLTPALARGLASVEIVPSRIRRIACVTGPGSFTGLRLAGATAAGLAAAVGAGQAGLPLLPLLAESAAATPGVNGETLGVMTHARRNLVYLQIFSLREGRLQALTGTSVMDPASALRRVREIDAEALVLGSGLSRNPQAELGDGLRPLGPEFDHPTPEALLRMADPLTYGPAPVTPLYVRPSDAEENLPQLAAGLGLNPVEAEAALRMFSAVPFGRHAS